MSVPITALVVDLAEYCHELTAKLDQEHKLIQALRNEIDDLKTVNMELAAELQVVKSRYGI